MVASDGPPIRHPLDIREMLLTDSCIGLLAPCSLLWFGPKLDSRCPSFESGGRTGLFPLHRNAVPHHLAVGPIRGSELEACAAMGFVLALLAIGCGRPDTAVAGVVLSLLGIYQARDFWKSLPVVRFAFSLLITIVFGAGAAILETMKAETGIG